MKRIVSLVLALSMVLSMFATAFAGNTLPDVEGTEYESAVSALVELGIVEGRDTGLYDPEGIVTRGEMAKFLVYASGMEEAAKLNVGNTNFGDVETSYWGTGCINVASEYGFINGYPDGTFAPKAQVKYSEAITMAIRALGYGARVETKGTWPTNYIQFAKELNVLDGISYKSFNDGATRGDVAKLMWNVLRTYMWDITEENESTGFNSSDAGKVTMIDKYFEDYTYATVLFKSVDITNKGEVIVTLDDEATVLDEKNTLGKDKYEYFGNDFYKFVANTEVEVLVNEEDETLLTIVPTGEDELVEGTIEELNDEEYENVPQTGDYIFAILDDDAITTSTKVTIESNTYVEEVEVKDSYIKVNNSRLKNSEDSDDALFEKEIVLKDGERVSMSDVKVGDVITKAKVNDEIFYVIGSNNVEGKLTKYVEENEVGKITVDDKKYTLDEEAKYVIDPEDEDEKAKTFATSTELEDMKNEKVVIICDALLGKVVRIEFDGDIGDDDDDTTGMFFAITEAVDKQGVGNYIIGLENENGSDSYVFADTCITGKDWYDDDEKYVGSYVFVELNDDSEIEEITLVVSIEADVALEDDFTYDEDEEKGYYTSIYSLAAKYDDKKGAITATEFDDMDVDGDVVVVTILTDDNKKKDDPSDDTYSIEFSEGLDAIKDLDGEPALVIFDNDATFIEAKYVVLFDDIANKSDIKVDVAKEVKGTEKVYAQNSLTSKWWDLQLDGETVLVDATEDETDYNEYKVFAYETEDIDDEDQDEFIYIAGLTRVELSDASDDTHGYVEDYDSKAKKVSVMYPGEELPRTIKLGNEDTEKEYKDCTFVLVVVDDADDYLATGEYVVDSVEIVDYADLSFEKADRISGTSSDDVIFIIRGMDEKVEVEDEEGNEGTEGTEGNA